MAQQLNDGAVVADLGRRLARLRLDRNVTQRALAAEAGVSLPTVQRLEGGRGATLAALVRVLGALDLLSGLEALVPERTPSPVEQIGRPRQRRRAAGGHSGRRGERSAGWSTATPNASPTAPLLATTSPIASPTAPTTGRVLPPAPEQTGGP
jgi:putative transcriptional regulator